VSNTLNCIQSLIIIIFFFRLLALDFCSLSCLRLISYSIPMLNDPHGPLIFVFICIGSIVATHVLFAVNGWIEPCITLEAVRNTFSSEHFLAKFRKGRRGDRRLHAAYADRSASSATTMNMNRRIRSPLQRVERNNADTEDETGDETGIMMMMMGTREVCGKSEAYL
jgi:hypothetical protein